MKPANNAPIYAGAYTALAEVCRKHGYALAVHGSIARDFDLVAIPWTERAADPDAVIKEITTEFFFKEKGEPEVKEHGRIVYTLIVSFGECFIDFSFMPTQPNDYCYMFGGMSVYGSKGAIVALKSQLKPTTQQSGG